MLFKPRKGRHFSRYAMGGVFLLCGLLLATQSVLAGSVFLPLAAIVFYYAPRWNLRIEIDGPAIRFSENVLDIEATELRLADIAEIRRVEEKEDRKGLILAYQEFHPFVEFETRAGKVYRMHDIFGSEFDEEILRIGPASGIALAAFPRDTESGSIPPDPSESPD